MINLLFIPRGSKVLFFLSENSIISTVQTKLNILNYSAHFISKEYAIVLKAVAIEGVSE
jgi:hypothetical protein